MYYLNFGETFRATRLEKMDERNIRHTIEPLSHDDFADFLSERNFHEDLISWFVSQRITGTAFLRLSE